MKVRVFREGVQLRARVSRDRALADARNLLIDQDGRRLDRWIQMVGQLRRDAEGKPPSPPADSLTLKCCGMQALQGSIAKVAPLTAEDGLAAGCRKPWPLWCLGSRAKGAAPIHQPNQGTTMSLETIMKAVDKIDEKFSGYGTDIAELRERVQGVEQRGGASGAMRAADAGGITRKTLGSMAFEELRKNSDLLSKTRSVRLELKAATDAITTASGRTIVTGGVGAPQGGVLGLQNGLPQRGAGSTSAVEYSRYTGQQGAAALQSAEGAAKAAVRPDHSIITQSALTIAGFCKISRQALNDRAELMSAIDITLNRSVMTALDVALVNGVSGFTGGIEGLATAYTSVVYTSLVDAISEGVSTMQVAGFVPNLVALNPADWLSITVAKGTDGHYLSGAYLGTMPMESRGLRVVLSPSVDAGKALLLDTAHVEMLIVDGFTVEVAYDSDDFTKNLATVLGEMRVLPVFRTVGAARLITPKP